MTRSVSINHPDGVIWYASGSRSAIYARRSVQTLAAVFGGRRTRTRKLGKRIWANVVQALQLGGPNFGVCWLSTSSERRERGINPVGETHKE